MAEWPQDGSLPPNGYDGLKTNYKKLSSALKEVHRNATDEVT